MNTINKGRKLGLFTIILSFGLLSLWPDLLVEGSPAITISEIADGSFQENVVLAGPSDQKPESQGSESYFISNNTFLTAVNTPITIQIRKVVATAYSSTHDQTDEDPFITASGAQVYDGVIATNFLPFGTKVKIPEIFGDKIFTVEDRMNERFGDNRIDIWFPDRTSAQKFGAQEALIEILNQ